MEKTETTTRRPTSTKPCLATDPETRCRNNCLAGWTTCEKHEALGEDRKARKARLEATR